MAEALTGASRAAVQRNLKWKEDRGLIREVTGQGRFRMWRACLVTLAFPTIGAARTASREARLRMPKR
jgi:hypothetical protein